MRSRYLLSSTVLFSLLLASCTSFFPAVRSADKRRDDNVSKAVDMNEKAKNPMAPLDMSKTLVTNEFYIGSTSRKKSDSNLLPVDVEQGGVTLVNAQTADLYEISEMITEATNLSVSIADDISSPPSGGSGNGSAGGAQGQGAAPSLASSNSGSASGTPSVLNKGKMRIDFNGPLSKFLERVSGYYNIGWNYKNGTIHFFRNATRTFSIAALPTQVSSSSNMSGGSSGSGSSVSGSSTSGSSSMSATASTKLDFWADFQNSIGTIVGSSGTYLVNKTAGTVTITAPYDVLEQAEEYIQYVNKVLLRQVVIRVEAYSVTLHASSIFGFSPAVIWGDSHNSLGFFGNSNAPTFPATTTPLPSGGSSTTQSPNPLSPAAIVAAAQSGSGVIGGIIKGPLTGTRGLFNLFDNDSDTTLLTSASLTTMSGTPVPLQVGTTQTYLSSVGSTTSGVGQTTVTITTSTLTSGFSLNLLPRVMDDGKVLLQYSIALTDKPQMDTVNVNVGGTTQALQMPTVSQKSFIQSALINNNSTLVLAGFENINDQDNKAGMGKSNFALFGGNYDIEKERVITVIALTPVVLDNEDTATNMKAKAI